MECFIIIHVMEHSPSTMKSTLDFKMNNDTDKRPAEEIQLSASGAFHVRIVSIIFHGSPLLVNFEHHTDTGTNILTQRSVSSHKHTQNDVVIASQHKSISRQASTLQRWQLQHGIRLPLVSLHVEKLRVGMTRKEMARDSLFCGCPV